jgi:16S rRNA G1207 methylase RsmC
VLARLLEGGTHRIVAGGALIVVVQRTIPMGRMGSEHYREVAQLAETDGFQVWRLGSPWPKGRVR